MRIFYNLRTQHTRSPSSAKGQQQITAVLRVDMERPISPLSKEWEAQFQNT
jgi:hypothetical protein